MQVDYIIVGQGLAGTVLAYTFQQHNKSVLVVDQGHTETSSYAAAGIYNPITGKRLVKTWQADLLFPYLTTFYQEMERELETDFFYPQSIYRPFASLEEQNTWIAQSAAPGMSRYVNINHNLDERYRSAITAPYGGMEIKEAGFVDVRKLVGAYRNYLRQKGLYRQEEVRYEEIIPTAAFVQWKEVQAKKIIFCDGAFTTQNPYFNWLPFSLVKGEIIHITIPDNSLEHIINQGIFILPLRNGVYKVGATYEWNELTWQPTLKAQEELLPKLKALLKLPFELVAHDAGIRPATADRRPLIGLHPHYQSVGIFNGLGTKGVSLAPYFARQLFEHLEYNKELPKEVYINRCFSLYYHSDNKLSI